mmetsp:Transcript_30741/g.41004  ORF Transcript_30741/g.41004 Transcript_30741/m.41004 type:complete len:84 (-) Transcript_30741:102-353(-)
MESESSSPNSLSPRRSILLRGPVLDWDGAHDLLLLEGSRRCVFRRGRRVCGSSPSEKELEGAVRFSVEESDMVSSWEPDPVSV